MEELPYQGLISAAEAGGTVLHRDQIYGSGPPVDAVSEEIFTYVAANVGRSVLDIGCGIGPYVERLTKAGHECMGIDTNEGAIRAARKLGRDVRLMSAYEIDFPDGSFDSVIMVESLEHLDNYERALEEASRVARYSIVVTTPDIGALMPLSKRLVAPWHILESTHVNFFTPEILRQQLLRYFRVCEATRLGHFFTVDDQPVYMHAAAVGRR